MTRITPRMLLEACYPMGDAHHPRGRKRRAVDRVVYDRWSLSAAADEAGADRKSVRAWVDEFETRTRWGLEADESGEALRLLEAEG
jgi:hypothetical protein